MSQPLLVESPAGLYCPPGDFYIDPWQPVERAVITHAHADHARPGHRRYLAVDEGRHIALARLGPTAPITFVVYGHEVLHGGVRVSLHPAGHIRGSAQVRLEYQGRVWVVTGDYKRQDDPTCRPFEPLACDTLVTESTFGLPIFRWPDVPSVVADILAWWKANQAAGRTSLLLAYALGKAQRLLKLIGQVTDHQPPGPIFTHGAVQHICDAYGRDGLLLPPTTTAVAKSNQKKTDWHNSLIVAPPSAQGTPWLRRFGDVSIAMASGWMRIRGIRRRRSIDRGFVLSDHVDWPGLLQTVRDSGAHRILAMHGYTAPVVRYLRGLNLDAAELKTRFLEPDDSLSPSTRLRESS